MTTLYVDTSALLKRVFVDPESVAVRAILRQAHDRGHLLTASTLAWLEVWRAVRRAGIADVDGIAGTATSGIAEHRLDESVLRRARRVGSGSSERWTPYTWPLLSVSVPMSS